MAPKGSEIAGGYKGVSRATTEKHMKQKINVGIIGLGTVGSGAFRILRDNAELIRHRVGVPVEVTKIAVRDATRDRGVAIPAGVLTTNPSQVIDDPNIDIVIELIGGYEPARELILAAIARGKHVVTANKALLAADGAEIHEAARRAGVSIGYEASVGGGIPVIKALKEALAANRILSIYGIINGTSNYILTKMTEEERSFADVLAEAQRAGYAEADPTFDVGGIDTAHKLAILVNLAFGAHVNLKDIYTEGITSISPLDIDFGKVLGYKLKLLAIAKMHEGGQAEARVHPTMVPDDYPIAKVAGVYHALWTRGRFNADRQRSGCRCYGYCAASNTDRAVPTGAATPPRITRRQRNIRCGPRPSTDGVDCQFVLLPIYGARPAWSVSSDFRHPGAPQDQHCPNDPAGAQARRLCATRDHDA